MQSDESLALIRQKYEKHIKYLKAKHESEVQAKDKEIEFYRQQILDQRQQILEHIKLAKMLAKQLKKQRSDVIITNEVNSTSESKAMTDSSSKNIKVGGDVTGSTLNIGEISGIVTNTINQLPASTQSDKPGIKELLTELQAAIGAETNLSDDDKAEALEQVKTLAEVGKNPQESTMQKAGKTAMKILKGTIAGLPSAATLVEACSKLLPAIASLLLLP
ncbi:hypothetical protein [Microcoleus sp. D3_18_C4]|uniref:hypothetical protein n=1 Tax=Microcoleus sp. D3_18_C4 TaxID=3055335 RepID=UPI002FCEFFEB